ncbi:dipeptide ABC transporter ATP-binding protein [Brevibacillus sp. SYP-B805]|uniref:dipeptide ABC transporter ATP-binding protein n=1 Tax=Brevibacillus sp. SYP-B805 TaxID=1578199 RepID=UPI0013EE0231|nr:dipeptide ABC transporter ATP-binding protein [Brevibacillus sp. SYP-B805]
MAEAAKQPLLEVTGLKKYFPIKGGVFGRVVQHVKAVDDISFTIYPGETVSIVGESGCGKSTTGRAILRLDEPTAGEIRFNGINLLALGKREMRRMRKDLQVIFQDPFASLNPRQTVGEILREALAIQQVVPKSQYTEKIMELLANVGMRPDSMDRYPHEFSGGQRQRIGIARALAVEPKLIVCDEAVSALDVSIQAQVLNLLKELQRKYRLAYLFISHDLGVVRHISDRVIVMYLGKIVEVADKQSLFANPQHPYTRALMSSIPLPDRRVKRERILLSGDVPSPLHPPAGCRFHTRCPYAVALCKEKAPEMKAAGETHQVACHLI